MIASLEKDIYVAAKDTIRCNIKICEQRNVNDIHKTDDVESVDVSSAYCALNVSDQCK